VTFGISKLSYESILSESEAYFKTQNYNGASQLNYSHLANYPQSAPKKRTTQTNLSQGTLSCTQQADSTREWSLTNRRAETSQK